MVESFIVLSALGGECIDDMRRLRDDAGLAGILGYTPPAAETARQWLDGFHDETVMSQKPLQGSFIPAESSAVAGLREINRRIIWSYIRNCMQKRELTLDVDTQLIETNKAEARRCYDGYKAYQAMKVCWAETLLILADEFRDGNVFPGKDITRIVDTAFDQVPPGDWKVKVRSDAAAYDQDILDHWDGRHWGFAVSAALHRQLKDEIEQLPDTVWQVWKTERSGVVREWAEVPYVPARGYEQKDSRPYRYLAVRVRRQQGAFFDDGTDVRHYAVVTNLWDMEGQALLEWQRGKAGTIEQVHHMLVSDLGARVFPSSKHGANAAWLRVQVITHNLLQLLKKAALPEDYAEAHPKRLRFAIFTAIGRVVMHAGQLLLRISSTLRDTILSPGRQKIALLVLDTG